MWQIQYLGRWGGNTVDIYVGEAFAELRAGWSCMDDGGALAKRARQEEKDEIQLWEVAAQIRELAPLIKDVQELKREMDGLKSEHSGWAAELQGNEVEFVDLAKEASQEGTFRVSAETVVKLKEAAASVCVVNTKSCVAHAVDIAYLASCEPGRWSAACGWRFREGDAVFSVGAHVGTYCSRAGCAQRFVGLKKVDEDQDDFDVEEG